MIKCKYLQNGTFLRWIIRVYTISNNVAMATLSGGTAAVKRRGKNPIASGQSVSEEIMTSLSSPVFSAYW